MRYSPSSDMHIDSKRNSRYSNWSQDDQDQYREQRSGSIDIQTYNAEAQRISVYPNEFRETTQDSNIPYGDTSIYHNRFSPKKKLPEEPVIFFGDSNTTELRPITRTTLDQDGLRRGSISTLPSASKKKRAFYPPTISEKKDDDDDDDDDEKTELVRHPSLSERAYAAAAGVAANIAGVASYFSYSDDTPKIHHVVRDEYGPYKDATNCNYEPAMHGQSPCFKSNEDGQQVINPDDQHPFCQEIQEPILAGERPITQVYSSSPNALCISPNNTPLHEPAMFGQSPCLTAKENTSAEITPDETHPFCQHVQEPSLDGERPDEQYFKDNYEFVVAAANATGYWAVTPVLPNQQQQALTVPTMSHQFYSPPPPQRCNDLNFTEEDANLAAANATGYFYHSPIMQDSADTTKGIYEDERFKHVKDSTGSSFVNKRYQRRQSRSSFKQAFSQAFRRLSIHKKDGDDDDNDGQVIRDIRDSENYNTDHDELNKSSVQKFVEKIIHNPKK